MTAVKAPDPADSRPWRTPHSHSSRMVSRHGRLNRARDYAEKAAVMADNHSAEAAVWATLAVYWQREADY